MSEKKYMLKNVGEMKPLWETLVLKWLCVDLLRAFG